MANQFCLQPERAETKTLIFLSPTRPPFELKRRDSINRVVFCWCASFFSLFLDLGGSKGFQRILLFVISHQSLGFQRIPRVLLSELSGGSEWPRGLCLRGFNGSRNNCSRLLRAEPETLKIAACGSPSSSYLPSRPLWLPKQSLWLPKHSRLKPKNHTI